MLFFSAILHCFTFGDTVFLYLLKSCFSCHSFSSCFWTDCIFWIRLTRTSFADLKLY